MTRIARELGISIGTVHNYKKKHVPGLATVKGGRVAKLSERTKANIRRKVLTGELRTATDIRARLSEDGCEVHRTTVSRALKSMNFKSKKKIDKPLLTARHKKLRLEWAKQHQHWTLDDWKRVVFSDETKINIWGSDGCRYYWTRPGDPAKDHHYNLTVKHEGGSLMMWGCMTYKGIGYGCQIEGTMRGEDYVKILRTTFKQTLEYWKLEIGDIIFQHDNDPKHTSRVAKEWLDGQGIEVLSWPPQSPDLNPIEHLWHYLKLRLATYDKKAKSIDELWKRCDREWNKIVPDVCKKYIESMPARVRAVLKAKGGHTRF
jgi:hypothetical protein